MKNIDIFKIVQILIPNYKCIVIPNLGAFILNKENDNKLVAPIFKLSFNSQLIHDDGILATYIQQQENISYDKALVELQQIVQNIKQDIASGTELVCGNLGTLFLENNTIVYKSNPAFIIPSSYGLSQIRLNTLSLIENQKVKELITNKRFRFKQNLLAASIGAAVVLLFLIPTDFITDNDSKQATEQASFLTNVSTIYNGNNTNHKQENYYIIIDSEKKTSEAENKLKALKNFDGFEQASILPVKKMQRIYSQKFTSKEEATQALSSLRDNNPRFSNAWLLTKTE